MILTQGTVFWFVILTFVNNRVTRCCSMLTYPLPLPPGIEKCPSMNTGIWAEAVGHPGISRLLFYEYCSFERNRTFLRFAFRGKDYQYMVLPFGLALAPRTFTKSMDAALAPLRLQGIRILNYLDDWPILASSREQVIRHRDSLLLHLCALGLRLNGQKSVLTPAQQTIFFGSLPGLNLDAGLSGPCSGREHSVVRGLLQARPAHVSGPVSQAPRPHGRQLPRFFPWGCSI